MQFVMEVETSWFNSDILLDNFILRLVHKYNMLRILWQTSELVRNPVLIILLFLLQFVLKLIVTIYLHELWMASHFSEQSVAGNQISFDDLAKIGKHIITYK